MRRADDEVAVGIGRRTVPSGNSFAATYPASADPTVGRAQRGRRRGRRGSGVVRPLAGRRRRGADGHALSHRLAAISIRPITVPTMNRVFS